MTRLPKRVYVKRRILVAASTVFFLSAGCGMIKEVTSPSFTCPDRTHTVVQGDSLWSIAAKHCEGDMLVVRYHLTQAYGPVIQPGDIIELP
jgi:nucleoid-associated protein YgaU